MTETPQFPTIQLSDEYMLVLSDVYRAPDRVNLFFKWQIKGIASGCVTLTADILHDIERFKRCLLKEVKKYDAKCETYFNITKKAHENFCMECRSFVVKKLNE